jgi:hypothetical protein
MSGLAITAFVLSLLAQCGSIFGIWWMNLLPLLLAVLAWPAIGGGRRRGGGFAIAASVLAVLGAAGSFLLAKNVRDACEETATNVLTALQDDDRKKLRAWVQPGEDADAAVARWKERFDKAQEVAGPFSKRTIFPSGLWGPMIGMAIPPGGLEEIGGEQGSALPPPGGTIWFDAVFEKETLKVGATFAMGDERDKAAKEEMKERAKDGKVLLFRELRFFHQK